MARNSQHQLKHHNQHQIQGMPRLLVQVHDCRERSLVSDACQLGGSISHSTALV
jgi:hypothetical protein